MTAYDTFDVDPQVILPYLDRVNTVAPLTVVCGPGVGLASSVVVPTTQGKKAGKWVVEFTCLGSSGSHDGVGLMSSDGVQADGNSDLSVLGTGSFYSGFLGGSNVVTLSQGVALMADGSVYLNNSVVSTSGTAKWGVGDAVALAIDLDSNLLWFSVNGGAWVGSGSGGAPDPATATAGIDVSSLANLEPTLAGYFGGPQCRLYPAVNLAGDYAAFTGNFGASAFKAAVPEGFTAGWVLQDAEFTFGSFANCNGGLVNAPPQGNVAVSPYVSSFTGPVGFVVMCYCASIGVVRAVIYDDGGPLGGPGALVGYSTTLTSNPFFPSYKGEVQFDFSGAALKAGRTYWIGVISPTASTYTSNSVSCPPVPRGIAYYNVASINPWSSGQPVLPDPVFSTSPTYANFRYPLLVVSGSVGEAAGYAGASGTSHAAAHSRGSVAAGSGLAASGGPPSAASIPSFPWPPDRGDTYTAVETAAVARQDATDGGDPRQRLDLADGATWQVTLQWTVSGGHFQELWSFYGDAVDAGGTANGSARFLMPLVLWYGYLVECLAYFVPGTMTTYAIDGQAYTVQATVEAAEPAWDPVYDAQVIAAVEQYGDADQAALALPWVFAPQ